MKVEREFAGRGGILAGEEGYRTSLFLGVELLALNRSAPSLI